MLGELIAAAVPAVTGHLFRDGDNRPAPNIERVGPSYTESGMARRWQQLTDDTMANYLRTLSEFERKYRGPNEMTPVDKRRYQELQDQLELYRYIQNPDRARHEFFLTKQQYDRDKQQYEREVQPLIQLRDQKLDRSKLLYEEKQKRLKNLNEAIAYYPRNNRAQYTIEALGRYLNADPDETFDEWIDKAGYSGKGLNYTPGEALDKGIYDYGNGITHLSGPWERSVTGYPGGKKIPLNDWRAKYHQPFEKARERDVNEVNALNKEVERLSQPYLPTIQQYNTWKDKLPLINDLSRAKQLEFEQSVLQQQGQQAAPQPNYVDDFFNRAGIPQDKRADVSNYYANLENLGKEAYKKQKLVKELERVQEQIRTNPSSLVFSPEVSLQLATSDIEKQDDLLRAAREKATQLFPKISRYLPDNGLNESSLASFEQQFKDAQNRQRTMGAAPDPSTQRLSEIQEEMSRLRSNPQVDNLLSQLPPPEVFKEKIDQLKQNYETVAPMTTPQLMAGETLNDLPRQLPRSYRELEDQINLLGQREAINDQSLANLGHISRELYGHNNMPMYQELMKMAQGDFDRLKYRVPGVFNQAGARNTAARVSAEQTLKAMMQSRAQSALNRFEHEDSKHRVDQGMRLEQLRGNLQGLSSDRHHRLYGDKRNLTDQYYNAMRQAAADQYKFGEEQQKLRQAENINRMQQHAISQNLPLSVAQQGLAEVRNTAPLAPHYGVSFGAPSNMETAGFAPDRGLYAFNAAANAVGQSPFGGGGGGAPAIPAMASGGRAYPSLQTIRNETEDDPFKNEYLDAIRNIQKVSEDKPTRWVEQTKRFANNLLERDPNTTSAAQALGKASRETDEFFENYKDKDIARSAHVGSMFETLNAAKRKQQEFLEKYHHNKATTEESAIGHDIQDRHNRASEEIQRENNALMNDLRREKFESLEEKRELDKEQNERKLAIQQQKADQINEYRSNLLNLKETHDKPNQDYVANMLTRSKSYRAMDKLLDQMHNAGGKLSNAGGLRAQYAKTPYWQAMSDVGDQSALEIIQKNAGLIANQQLSALKGNQGVRLFEKEEKTIPNEKMTIESFDKMLTDRAVENIIESKFDETVSKYSAVKKLAPLKAGITLMPDVNAISKDIFETIEKQKLPYKEAKEYAEMRMKELYDNIEDVDTERLPLDDDIDSDGDDKSLDNISEDLKNVTPEEARKILKAQGLL